MKRQKIRKTIIFISFLLFPITIWYFSPYLIVQALSGHIMNGSFIVFVSMFVLSMFFGRAWCGYLCPAGGLQECCGIINNNIPKQGFRNYIKYVIWSLWLISLIVIFILGKGELKIDFFYMTDHGISITDIYNYVIYYGVILLFILPTLISGRRASCHYLCWMAPFMIIGSKFGQFLHLPQLHLEASKTDCISCGKCNAVCPMGLDVKKMISCNYNSKCSECIQCGACIDNCPTRTIKYKFVWRRK